MTTMDKAAIGWSIAIVAVGVAIAFAGQSGQILTPEVNIPEPPKPIDEATEPTMEKEAPEAQMADPFADIADKVKSGQTTKPLKADWERMESMQDPGVGHEQHQLAVLLAPSDKVYSGTLQYDASEPIQLVTLHGPLGPGEDSGQAIWTPDGETKFALTFVDPKKASGEWKFAGNALAVHTMKTTPFTVDYKIDYTVAQAKTVTTGTMESMQDPGVGHESHQLAIILAPSEKTYSGILSYSSSEPIQLVSLRGPISASEKPAMTWTPDGETIFELTFVDPKKSMGSWAFSGNALAVHTMKTTPFTVSYSVSAKAEVGKAVELKEEMKASETMPKSDTMSDTPSAPKTANVSMPTGTSVPGCEETDECYIPASVTISKGGKVVWTNDDTAAHTVTAGTPNEGPSGTFDSSLVMGGNTFEYTFNESESYDYFCMVHPWMVGNVQVN